MDATAEQILTTWFTEPVSSHWFASTAEIDQQLEKQFKAAWQLAANGRLDHWQGSAEECLALVILLDQIPLNIFRGQPESFATEQAAMLATKHAIEKHYDEQIESVRLGFLYMPLMHSENIDDQNLSVACFKKAGLAHNLRFARHHQDIIRQFGRFPHRNEILGRSSTAEELNYLSSDNAFKG